MNDFDIIYCNNCGYPNAIGSSYCVRCSMPITVYRVCISCGQVITDDSALVCPDCGAAIESASPLDSGDDAAAKKRATTKKRGGSKTAPQTRATRVFRQTEPPEEEQPEPEDFSADEYEFSADSSADDDDSSYLSYSEWESEDRMTEEAEALQDELLDEQSENFAGHVRSGVIVAGVIAFVAIVLAAQAIIW